MNKRTSATSRSDCIVDAPLWSIPRTDQFQDPFHVSLSDPFHVSRFRFRFRFNVCPLLPEPERAVVSAFRVWMMSKPSCIAFSRGKPRSRNESGLK